MDTPSDALLARYLAGECDPAERRAIEQWSAASLANRARLDAARGIWNTRRPPKTWDVEGMWQRVRHAVAAEGHRPAFGRHLHGQRGHRGLQAGLAAAAVLIVVAGASLLVIRGKDRAPAMREYATARGQRITLQLPDSTTLILAPESRLRIPERFGRGSRELSLEGEALFTVAHDAQRPFRVHARHAVAEDIGTRFDVRAYPEDSLVAVAVAEGTVALGRVAAEGVVVRSGEVATLSPAGLVGTGPTGALAGYLSWADGRLHFANVPLPAVLRTIGRWYDLDVRVEGRTLATRSITAELATQSPDEMLQALAVAVAARVTRSGEGGRVVTLSAAP
jgi:transmembrane sensor